MTEKASPGKNCFAGEKLFQQAGRTDVDVFLGSVGDGDLGVKVALEDKRILTRDESPHRRRLHTVFGEFFSTAASTVLAVTWWSN